MLEFSYRDAADHGDGVFERMPSPTIINRQAREYENKLKQFLPDCVADTDADAVIPDATKCHGQEEDCSYHSVQTLDRFATRPLGPGISVK